MTTEPAESPSSNEMRAFAYRLLGHREYSVFELERRIRQKWPDASGIGELVGALADEDLVSDRRYTEAFVRFRVQKYQGPLKIKADLRSKGVSDGLISSELDARSGEWAELAGSWLQRQGPGMLDFEAKKKYYRRLMSRGFTHGQAMDALNQQSNRTHSTRD